MADKIYPKGLICFAPHANAPDFALGDVTISLNELFQWAKDNPEHLTEYKGNKQLRLQLTRGRDGRPSLSVNTWKPEAKREKVVPYKDSELHQEAKEQFAKRELVDLNGSNDNSDLPF